MFDRNHSIILDTDGYKLTHWKQYPPGTEIVYSYLESRGGMFPSTVFFGLQYYLLRYLQGNVVDPYDIERARRRSARYIGAENFNFEGWEYIVREHGGRLPVRIRAVPEGTDVGTHNVLTTIENTDPKCFWLTNYLETMLSRVWYPTTVATLSNYTRRRLSRYLRKTGNDVGIDYMFHDFGARGVSSLETAGLGGAAHLLNFDGTDTIAGIELLSEYYFPSDNDRIGETIPASEHSTITSWGEDREVDAYRNMLRSYPNGMVACVSDSFDIYKACSEHWGNTLRMDVLSRDGVLVVRPDSGDPTKVVLGCLERLAHAFGSTTNAKGFKVLHPNVRIIQGDGVTYDKIDEILFALYDAGWAAENVAFGSGGGLLQKMDRDTQRFAIKCSAVRIDGVWHDVYKDPVTDPGKLSKRGRLMLARSPLGPTTIREDASPSGLPDMLQDVFVDGECVNIQSLADIRARARAAAEKI